MKNLLGPKEVRFSLNFGGVDLSGLTMTQVKACLRTDEVVTGVKISSFNTVCPASVGIIFLTD